MRSHVTILCAVDPWNGPFEFSEAKKDSGSLIKPGELLVVGEYGGANEVKQRRGRGGWGGGYDLHGG